MTIAGIDVSDRCSIDVDDANSVEVSERVFANGPVARRRGHGFIISIDRFHIGRQWPWIRIARNPRGEAFIPSTWTVGDVIETGGQESP